MTVIIRAARPGVVIGSNGESIEQLKKKLEKMCAGKHDPPRTWLRVANPDLDAHLVARAIAEQLEQRASFSNLPEASDSEDDAGRRQGYPTAWFPAVLGGADIARSEGYSEGVVPLHTLRSDMLTSQW